MKKRSIRSVFFGVRFIAVNDNYDSSTCSGAYGEIDIAFKEILNDLYSEDLSEKVKSSLDIRRGNGKYICTCPPYGFRKADDNKYQLVIDEPAAGVVRRIFSEYAEGKSMYSICHELNTAGVPCPLVYLRRNKLGFSNGKDTGAGYVWSVTAVSRILHNEVYIGNMFYGKSRAADTGQKQNKHIPYEEWKKVEGTHSSIVDRDTFEKVRIRLSGNRKVRTRTDDKKDALLRGFVICAGCGRRMYLDSRGRGRYYCTNRYSDRYHDDCASPISNAELEEIVFSELKRYVQNYVDMKRVLAYQTALKLQKIKVLEKAVRSLDQKMTKAKEELMAAFEGYAKGRIDRDDYLMFKEKSDMVLEKFRNEKSEKQGELKQLNEEKDAINECISISEKMIAVDKPDRDIAAMLIENVAVDKAGVIEIHWKFKMPER